MPSKYKKIYPSLKEFDTLKNPMTNMGFVIKVTRAGASGRFHKPDIDGIILPKYVDLEREEYTKVFKNPDLRKVISDMSDRAKSLFLWLLFEVDMGKDYLWINHLRFMEENNISSLTTYKLALKELLMKNLICKSHKRTIYWINPKAFFCGSRPNKYPEHVEVVQEITKFAEPKVIPMKRTG